MHPLRFYLVYLPRRHPVTCSFWFAVGVVLGLGILDTFGYFS